MDSICNTLQIELLAHISDTLYLMDGAIGELLIGGSNCNADELTNLDDLMGYG